jgi:cobalt-zinc-cadmium resistance protein CzcA
VIDRILESSLRNRVMVLLFAGAIVGGGAWGLARLPIDAFPDVSPVLVQVITESPGLAPEEVEKLVTYPVEVAMNSIPGVAQVKSLSAFGISQVNVYFDDDVDIYFARQLVLERLQRAREEIPEGLGEPVLGPITSGLGQVYQYTVRGRGYDQMELRTLQDWIVKYNLRTVPGVTEVLSFGGQVKQYQVRVDPGRMLQYGVALDEVLEAIRRNNRNVGGGYIVRNAEEILVRGLGLAQDLEDIGDIVVETREGTPVYVRNVADVVVGPEVRRGAVTKDGGGEVVAGVVLKLLGENTSAVIERVKEEIAEINAILPEGVRAVPFYDQTELVDRAVDTVKDALLEGGVLIALVLVLFLGNVRSALVVATMLPLAALIAFFLMAVFGISANLMSLGGLAIGIGMMVDGGVVMVENIHRHLSGSHGGGGTSPGGASHAGEPALHVVLRAAREVGRPIVFAIAIIVLVFLPLFTLEGVEGKLFKPMAYTISFAMAGSLVLSLTVIPVLASFFLKGGGHSETWVMRRIKPRYLPMLDWAMANRRTTVFGAVGGLALSLAAFPFLGTEFVPALEEGSIMVRATMAPSAGLDEAIRMAGVMEREMMAFPEVTTAVSKIGRAEAGGDPEPVNNIETYVGLVPHDRWRFGSKAELVEALDERLGRLPGVLLNFSQPIAFRVDELLSGVRAQLAISVFGEDLDVLASVAGDISAVVREIPGAADVQVEQVTGQPQLQIRLDREAVARYGLNVSGVQEVIESAVGGEAVGQVFEGSRRFDIFVRLQEPFRENADAIAAILVSTPEHGPQVPLAQLADIAVVTGPKQISHERNQRRVVVQANVRGRDMGGFVAEARRAVAASVDLPAGYQVTWGGQFENQQRAMRRLSIIVPLTIGLIFLLLFFSFGSLKQALLIILNVPFALIGGILALFLTGQYLSVPASVGFIALFGVAVLNGVVLVSTINALRMEGLPLEEAVRRGTELRLRPVLMTALVASLGLVPLLLSGGAGSEVQRPLATVVVAGLFTSTLLTLLLLPTLYAWFERRRAPDVVASEAAP